MTREEFRKVLDDKGYSYKIEGDKIVITHDGRVDLRSLKTLPPGVEFKNGGNVNLESLKTLPPDVEFDNAGSVFLEKLKTLPPGVEFKNFYHVNLESLETLLPGVEFNNIGDVKLKFGWFSEWKGLIDGIAPNPNTLLNVMIKRGIFL